MVTELPRRTSFSGPTLVRLLSRLAQVEVAEPRQSPAARLDEWLGWTESIWLSKVLGAGLPASAHGTGRVEPAVNSTADPAGDEMVDAADLACAQFAQARDALEQAIAAALAPPAPLTAMQRRQMRGGPKAVADVDFPSYRRRHAVLQQKMETALAALRVQLRAHLVAASPELAQLAAIDAAMEQALAEKELVLLNGVPKVLERRFEQGVRAAPLQEGGRPAPGPWLDEFIEDMRKVLAAELDLRMQPHAGLLCALRGE